MDSSILFILRNFGRLYGLTMLGQKTGSDFFFLVILLCSYLVSRFDSDMGLNDRHFRVPESQAVYLGSSSAYTQITFHSPYQSTGYPYLKNLEYSEQDEIASLFNRLNYYNSVRERSSLIAYYSSSTGDQNAEASIEGTNAEVAAATGGDSSSDNPPLPTTAEDDRSMMSNEESWNLYLRSFYNDLTPEVIEIFN